MSRTSTLSRYRWLMPMAASQQIVSALGALGSFVAQIEEGESQVVNIRETDDRLGPLVFGLVGLGAATLVATIIFWWLTRPRPDQEPIHG